MRLFLSHDFGERDGPIASRLKAIAAAYGIEIVVPGLYAQARETTRGLSEMVRSSDAVLVFATIDAARSKWVQLELRMALASKKPIIALVEDGVLLSRDLARVPVVRFDRRNPRAHETELMAALTSLGERAQSDPSMVGWIIAIALGLVGLSALTGDEGSERRSSQRRPVSRKKRKP